MPDRTSQSSRHTKAAATGKVRVIGGEWRGRWIRFADAEGLRPTGDRMRETLFNWLQTWIRGARCLDLFAGTGVLGIEAVSRGGSLSVLIEQNLSVCQQLEHEIQNLSSNLPERGQCLPVYTMTAEAFLRDPLAVAGQFDIVFIDPPFSQNVQLDILSLLEQSGLLASAALVYVEAPASMALETQLPAAFEIHRSLRQGNVQCLLLEWVEPRR